jgi:hypothetical protein
MAGGGGFDLGKRWENGHQKPSETIQKYGKIWKNMEKVCKIPGEILGI